MQTLANPLTDIFTEADETIFSDGSLDPMGLRIIWTALGAAIFGNRLNTISNNIKLYTFNLFHHHLIREIELLYPEFYQKAVASGPYAADNDLREGLIIFLECLQAQVVFNSRDDYAHGEEAFVPGMSKLSGLAQNRPESRLVTHILANRNDGILVRQIGLGIHGRHKGPFGEMEIFGPQFYYEYADVWDRVREIFTSVPEWSQLAKMATRMIQILFKNPVLKDGLELAVETVISTNGLAEAYHACFEASVYQHPLLIAFWEERLGLHQGSASSVYNSIKRSPEGDWQEIIQNAWIHATDGKAQLAAILQIEPFLTMISKTMLRLLQRGQVEIDSELVSFIELWRERIHLSINDPLVDEPFLTPAAATRLARLITISQQFKLDLNYAGFIQQLVDYHGEIVRNRGNLPWVSFQDGRLRQHRSRAYSARELTDQTTTDWVNNYYVPSLQNIYKGLYRTT